ncbi:MAG: hypothetical protein ACK5PQ_02580 [Alphaproteobacteria bacterium]
MKYFIFLAALAFVFLQHSWATIEEKRDQTPVKKVWSVEDGTERLERLKTETFSVSIDIRNLAGGEEWKDFPCSYLNFLSIQTGNSDWLKSTPADLYNSLCTSFCYIQNGIVIGGCTIHPDKRDHLFQKLCALSVRS